MDHINPHEYIQFKTLKELEEEIGLYFVSSLKTEEEEPLSNLEQSDLS